MEEYRRRLKDVIRICEKSVNKDNEYICDIILSQYLVNCERK